MDDDDWKIDFELYIMLLSGYGNITPSINQYVQSLQYVGLHQTLYNDYIGWL